MVPPDWRDARLHIAAVIITIHVLGQVALDFAVSVPQILAAIATCAVVEVVVTFGRDRTFVWPASAMLTGSGVALILRDLGTEPGDHWTFRSWWLFALVAGLSLATKYVIRWRGAHLFNPSNVGLVAAFLVLGSDRIEPLDFWWGPFDGWMLAAYVVIVGGGLAVTGRLGLLGMAGAFWLTLIASTASLALTGHCITARWSVTPICDWHYWWVVATSPEVLVFLFFMITDPRTVPTGRWPRVGFGAAVGVASALLMAPQTTEFGAKVALLGGLVVVCAARPLLAALPTAPVPEPVDAGGATTPPVRSAAPITGWRQRAVVGVVGAVTAGAVLLGVAAAGAPARTVDRPVSVVELPDPDGIVPAVDPARVPAVTADGDVAELGIGAGGVPDTEIAGDLVRNLDVEALALIEGDTAMLYAVDHGNRLHRMHDRVTDGADGPVTVPEYRFDSMHLVVVQAGQAAPRPGIEARGTVVEVTYDADRRETGRTSSAFAAVFVMREGSDGRWLLIDELPVVSE